MRDVSKRSRVWLHPQALGNPVLLVMLAQGWEITVDARLTNPADWVYKGPTLPYSRGWRDWRMVYGSSSDA